MYLIWLYIYLYLIWLGVVPAPVLQQRAVEVGVVAAALLEHQAAQRQQLLQAGRDPVVYDMRVSYIGCTA